MTFWWDRARCVRADVPALEAVIFDIDAIPADPGLDGPVVCDLVWGLHCSGVRIAIATAGSHADIEPLVRDLIGDGVVEVMVTSDEVSQPKPDPEVYLRVLDELGVSPAHAMAVEDCADGLRAARAAGLATVVVADREVRDQDFAGAAAVLPGYNGPEPLSAQSCRTLRERWWIGHQLTA